MRRVRPPDVLSARGCTVGRAAGVHKAYPPRLRGARSVAEDVMYMPLEDLLFEWALHHFPYVLQDQELFDGLLHLIRALLSETARKEREATTRRVLTPSRS